jgi:methylisocitrate lyase
MNTTSAGKKLRDALNHEQPLQIAGTINAYCAILAEHSGFKALYLSGAGVANASYGLPDLGLTTLDNVVEDIRRITRATSLPLLADADTGFDDIATTVNSFINAGAAGLHIEDQISQKRCGHRPNKKLVSCDEMCDRIRTAVAARTDHNFVIMARTDALAVEGMESALQRIHHYIAAGADMIFPEALTELAQYRQIRAAIKVPILANITEFGKTPLFTVDELRSAGVDIVLYPLTAFRAMSAAALETYTTLRSAGTQKSLLEKMQTREELYHHLDYYRYESKLDRGRDKGFDEELNDGQRT